MMLLLMLILLGERAKQMHFIGQNFHKKYKKQLVQKSRRIIMFAPLENSEPLFFKDH